ncbi:Holliday junction resolvase RuvX [Anaeroselena agilis]|uniref:Putative pre-16S rRNA nuclease n=1 Tax=Anaeroselena agilis TaxID=3063788 RepID=A0ABU3NW56_9FIRM|nr:Holliday junction resolvase RuvX [Selenomonadales bacterium 4137-cl]
MRILALDVGERTIGVAVSDELGLTAQGLEVIRRTSPAADFRRLAELVAAYKVDTFLIGLPKNMNGTIGPRGESTQRFAAEIAAAFPSCGVKLWDERLSTVAAERSLIEADVSRRRRREVIDKMAAVFILQGYLDSKPAQKLP